MSCFQIFQLIGLCPDPPGLTRWDCGVDLQLDIVLTSRFFIFVYLFTKHAFTDILERDSILQILYLLVELGETATKYRKAATADP